MITARRIVDRRRLEPAAGPALTLVSETWMAVASVGGRGAGLSYRRPARIEIDAGRSVRLVDHAIVVRLVSAAAVFIAHAINRRVI